MSNRFHCAFSVVIFFIYLQCLSNKILRLKIKFIRRFRDKMRQYVNKIEGFFKESVTLHMYSDPNFVTEIFLYCVVLLLYSILNVYISRKSEERQRETGGKENAMKRKLLQWMKENSAVAERKQQRRGIYRYRPNRLRFEESETQMYLNGGDTISRSSSTISHYSAKTYTDENFKRSMLGAPQDWIFCSPQTYLQRVKLERDMARNVSKESLISLSTLCGNVINREYSCDTLNRRIDLIREEESCNALRSRKILFRDKIEIMTESVFDLIESYTSGERKCPNGVDVVDVILEASDKKFKSSSRKSRQENTLMQKYFDQRGLLNIAEF